MRGYMRKAVIPALVSALLAAGCGNLPPEVDELMEQVKDYAKDYAKEQILAAASGIDEESGADHEPEQEKNKEADGENLTDHGKQGSSGMLTDDEQEGTSGAETESHKDEWSGSSEGDTEESLEETAEDASSENLVTDAYGEEFGGRSFHIPQINIDSYQVKLMNKEIWDTLYYGVVSDIEKWWGEKKTEGLESITYTWTVNGDILSLVIESQPYDWAWTDYYVYNLSLPEGDVVSDEELFAYRGVTRTEFEEKVRQVLYTMHFENCEESIYQKNDEQDRARADEVLAKSLSPENVSASVPFLNEAGELCAVCAKYSFAGADYYYNILNLENYTLPEHYPEGYPVPEADGSPFAGYKAILQSYPVSVENTLTVNGEPKVFTSYSQYTLYDIDKDGIPELIVADGSKSRWYDVYTLEGDGAVNCGALYPYANGLREYDGNGIVVYQGGMGSLHLEYLSVYALEENMLVAEGDISNTEEDAYEELQSNLADYPPIEPFCHVDDYTLLERYE